MKKRMIISLLSIAVSGCAGGPFEWKYGHDKIVPGQFSMSHTEKNGTVLTWPSHAVAAIVYPNGDTACIQSAQSAKARNAAGAGNISIPVNNEQVGGALGQTLKEAVASIQDRNDVATFLDVALFQICTISRNKQLTADQTMALVEKALETSENIAKARSNLNQLNNKTIQPEEAVVNVNVDIEDSSKEE